MLNEKGLYLIDSHSCAQYDITGDDIFNAYTGIGGLHGLNREDFDNYHEYSEQKKIFESGQFFTPPQLCELVMACLRLSEYDLVADLTCGMGNFFNHAPVETNVYGCELDLNAYKVSRYQVPICPLLRVSAPVLYPGNAEGYGLQGVAANQDNGGQGAVLPAPGAAEAEPEAGAGRHRSGQTE